MKASGCDVGALRIPARNRKNPAIRSVTRGGAPAVCRALSDRPRSRARGTSHRGASNRTAWACSGPCACPSHGVPSARPSAATSSTAHRPLARPRSSRAPGGRRAAPRATDDDLQLSLAVCYELHYRGFDGVSEDWEWDPALIAAAHRARAPAPRRRCATLVGPLRRRDEPIDRQLAALIAADDGPSLSSLHGQAGHARAVAGVPDRCGRSTTSRRATRTPSRSPASPAARRRRWSRSRPTSTAAARPRACTASCSPA